MPSGAKNSLRLPSSPSSDGVALCPDAAFASEMEKGGVLNFAVSDRPGFTDNVNHR
jgi:hypothetical protein